MYKCYACGKEIENPGELCPFCRFPVISTLHGEKVEEEQILAFAEEYRRANPEFFAEEERQREEEERKRQEEERKRRVEEELKRREEEARKRREEEARKRREEEARKRREEEERKRQEEERKRKEEEERKRQKKAENTKIVGCFLAVLGIIALVLVLPKAKTCLNIGSQDAKDAETVSSTEKAVIADSSEKDEASDLADDQTGEEASGDEGTINDYEYSLQEDNTAKIDKYNGSESSISIPSEIDGYQVTAIGDRAFESHHELISITIPNSVTSIGDSAFRFCYGLTSIIIPDSVIEIGTNPFEFCSLLQNIWVSENQSFFEVVNGGLFSKEDGRLITYPCGLQADEYDIPDGTRIIGNSAFARCSSLTKITVPDSVIEIEAYAFSECVNLNDIIIPDSVTTLGYSLFASCSSLTHFTVQDSVTLISDYTFQYCTELRSITIPESVLYIGDHVFYHCDNLIAEVKKSSMAELFCETHNIAYKLID